jgi:hypothetical protein
MIYMAEETEFYTRIIALERVSGPASAEQEAEVWEKARQAVAEQELPDNEAKQAVDHYWGQFLKSV